jgi:hypothetical protein
VAADAEQAVAEPLPRGEDALGGVYADFVQRPPWTRRHPAVPRP